MRSNHAQMQLPAMSNAYPSFLRDWEASGTYILYRFGVSCVCELQYCTYVLYTYKFVQPTSEVFASVYQYNK